MKKLLIVITLIIMINFITPTIALSDDLDAIVESSTVEMKKTNFMEKITHNLKYMYKMNIYNSVLTEKYEYY